MINPARRTATAEGLQRYRAEPYVVAADVYSQEPHAGRGGWTWYTGSASWMYRVALEGLLGVTLHGGDTLRVEPCIPPTWDGFEVTLRRPGATEYVVVVENPHAASTGRRAHRARRGRARGQVGEAGRGRAQARRAGRDERPARARTRRSAAANRSADYAD